MADEPKKLPDRVADLEAALSTIEDRLLTADERLDHLAAKLSATTADVREVIHDLVVGADLLGNLMGEPFRSQARELVSKRQTADTKE